MHVRDLILVSVGNTRTRIARAAVASESGGALGELHPSLALESTDISGQTAEITRLSDLVEAESARVLISSVNPTATAALEKALAGLPGLPAVVRMSLNGAGGIKIPQAVNLDAAASPGEDRLLAALAAHDRSRAACVVIDAGTAVTVDLIDQYGVFQGGVIVPGVGAMLDALARTTAQLPKVAAPTGQGEVPNGPVGKNTRDAMVLGALQAVRGLCHRMIDQYAETTGRYPRVIATGGDAPLLFRDDEFVEHLVPDLVLIGMQTAFARVEQPGLLAARDDTELDEAEEATDADDFEADPFSADATEEERER